MSSLFQAATCPAKSWETQHQGRSVLGVISYCSTLHHCAPATQVPFLPQISQALTRLKAFAHAVTPAQHTFLSHHVAGFFSSFRTQLKCHFLKDLGKLRVKLALSQSPLSYCTALFSLEHLSPYGIIYLLPSSTRI